MKLVIIIASTRPGRIGGTIGAWITEYATKTTDFDVSVADLAELNLPLFDEPNHPMRAEYTKDHTKAWSQIIDAADAFVVVTPEYNYTMPPSLSNAIDYLHHEWAHKPVGFVGYGGTGAVRAIQTEKLLFANLNVMPINLAVTMPGVHALTGIPFAATGIHEKAADGMLAELKRWAEALLPLHQSNSGH